MSESILIYVLSNSMTVLLLSLRLSGECHVSVKFVIVAFSLIVCCLDLTSDELGNGFYSEVHVKRGIPDVLR